LAVNVQKHPLSAKYKIYIWLNQYFTTHFQPTINRVVLKKQAPQRVLRGLIIEENDMIILRG
jgi:hypothetical protein